MITIESAGQRIIETNYWDSEQAQRGFFFLSWNAGAGRLLVPDVNKPMLREMRRAREVIVSRGPWAEQGGREALELLWEDDSDQPFAVHLVAEQCDRMPPDADQGGGFVIAVWTRGGMKQRWPGRYRRVERLPSGAPWVVQ